MMGMNVVVSCPKGFDPAKSMITSARKLAAESGGEVELIRDPDRAVEGADILYTDVWVSMGQEKGGMAKEKKFRAYQLSSNLVSKARGDCSVMHCLPAHRGLEITDDVLEGKKSIVWRQSENKLHGARAVLTAFLT